MEEEFEEQIDRDLIEIQQDLHERIEIFSVKQNLRQSCRTLRDLMYLGSENAEVYYKILQYHRILISFIDSKLSDQ